ncbi:MAG: hypothetical protein ACFBSD_11585 [Paracoccaceae bacterium]
MQPFPGSAIALAVGLIAAGPPTKTADDAPRPAVFRAIARSPSTGAIGFGTGPTLSIAKDRAVIACIGQGGVAQECRTGVQIRR